MSRGPHGDDLPHPDALPPSVGPTFDKRRHDAPPGFFAVEVAGLRWLAEAEVSGGVSVARPLAVCRDRIVLQRLHPAAADRRAAEEFGRRLARTHRRGASRHGCPPGGWTGDGFIGPITLPHAVTPPGPATDPAGPPIDLPTGPVAGPPAGGSADGKTPADTRAWGGFYADLRVLPYARGAARAGALGAADLSTVEGLCDRLRDGDADLTGPPEPVARLHGDLWSGNVMWTAAGAVLIDPAAHGGHRETDLAMLALFGLAYLDRVLAAYQEVWPLSPGWRHRVGLHQLHPLLVHAVLFGSGYGAQAAAVARRYARGS